MILRNLGSYLIRIGLRIQFQPHLQIAAEFDVGPAPGHVCRNRNCARRAGLGHDGRFLLMESGVQHFMLDLLFGEQVADDFALLDTGRTDQHRLPALPAFLDQLCHRLVFFGSRAIHLVIVVLAADPDIGRDFDHLQLVDLLELVGLGQRRAGHAGQLRKQPEIILEGDRGQRLVLALHHHPLLGLQRLMQAVGIAPAVHHAAGELVDDHHLAGADDVVDITGVQHMRAQALLNVMDQRNIENVI